MTHSALGVLAVYSGSGSAGPFTMVDGDANPILFEDNDDIQVLRFDIGETVDFDLLVEGVGYTITGAGSPSAGTITLATVLAAGESIVIRRDTAKTQVMDMVFGGDLSLDSLEESLDKLTRISQELGEQTGRSIRFSPINAAGLDEASFLLPAPVAGSVLGWNADEDALINVSSTVTAASVSPFIEALLDDASAAAARLTLGAIGANESVNGYLDFAEISAPSSPAANFARVYASDNGSGTTLFSMKDSGGNIVPMSHFLQSGTGAISRTYQQRARDVIYAADFGVTANGSTDDTTAMQNAINAALAFNLPLQLPRGNIKLTSGLNIAGSLKMSGGGHLDTVFVPTNTTESVLQIDSFFGVTFEDFGIDAQGITMTNGAGIYVTETNSSRNVESVFRNIRVIGTYYGIIFDRAATWVMDGCYVYGCKNIGVTVRNLYDDDEGDSVMKGCTVGYFDASPTSDNILVFQTSSGGLKISGCKLIGGYHGYHLGLEAGAQTLGPIISGNSFENQTAASIFLGPDNDATSLIARTVITGNEIAPFGNGHGIQIGGTTTPGWCRGVTIVGNNITVDLNAAAASSARAITAAFATDLTIVGNVLKNDGATGTTVAIELGSGVTRVSKGINIINGFASDLSDGSTSPQFEIIRGGIRTFDLFYAQSASPGFWLDETDSPAKGALVVLDGNVLQVQRRSGNFGGFEATLLSIDVTTGRLTATETIKTMTSTVASLPAAGTVGSGARAYVTDATTVTFAAAATGGGANGVPVFSNGSTWRVG